MKNTVEQLQAIINEQYAMLDECSVALGTPAAEFHKLRDIAKHAEQALVAAEAGKKVGIEEIRRPCALVASGSIVEDYKFKISK